MKGVSTRWAAADRQEGFALVEVIVAFVVLALGLGALAVGVTTAIRTDVRTESHRTALRLAQSQLELAGIAEDLAGGPRQGVIAGKYRWRQTATPVRLAGEARPDSRPATDVRLPLTAYWVEVTVQAERGTMVRLAALKLGPETKP